MDIKPNIVFYINNLEKGGAERAILQLATGFYEQNYETTIITTFEGNNEYDFPKGLNRINLLEEQDTGNRIIRNLSLIIKLRKILKTQKPDFLISFMVEANFRAILATVGLKTKCIVSVRNDPEKEYVGKLGKIIGKYIMPIADGCVFQTNDALNWFPKKLQRKSKIIYNAVKDEFFNVQRNVEENTVVTCGRLEEQKNHKMLIDAFEIVVKQCKDAKLLIYGEGSLRNELQNIIDERVLSNNIKLCGNTNDVLGVLSKAEIFVLSSDYEGMPNALMEALAAGVPSISTDCPCGGPRMLIKDNESGVLVGTGSHIELSSAIINLLQDRELQDKYSTESKKNAYQYKSTIVLKSWIEFLDSLKLND